MDDIIFWILAIGGLLSFGASIWYYSSLGKRVSEEESDAGRDLTYEINPFTGSAKGSKIDEEDK